MRQREQNGRVSWWYGNDTRNAEQGSQEETTEGIVKFEYASILWLPVFCPGQPVVRVSCPRLLKRYQQLAGLDQHTFEPYTYYGKKDKHRNKLFFNLGFLPLKDYDAELKHYIPSEISDAEDYLLVVVDDTEIAMIHDMALYRQSRVALEDNQKKVSGKAFFNVEAIPEGTVLVFPVALRQQYKDQDINWQNFAEEAAVSECREVYFGGLESVGFGRCSVVLKQQP
jgi:CRISPR-associated protein Cmr4